MTLRTLLTALYLLIAIRGYAQKCSIREVREYPRGQHFTPEDLKIRYPLLSYNGAAVSDKINDVVQKEFYDYFGVNDTVPLRRGIIIASREITGMSGRILFCSKELVCVEVHYGAIGAYPVEWSRYYTFNGRGNRMTIDSLVAPSKLNAFKKALNSRQAANIKQAISDWKDLLSTGEIDSAALEDMLQIVKDSCVSSYDPLHFAIDNAGMKVILGCGFPHAIQSMSPHSDVIFSKAEIQDLFKNEYKFLYGH